MDNVDKLMVEKRIGDDAGNSFNDNWTQCWDYVLTGVFIKLATLSDKPIYKEIAEDHIDYWQNRLKSSPGGIKFLDSWGVCKYPAAESMVQLVYYKYTGDKSCLDFAKSQIDYILGDNPKKMSYVVGFGDNYPKFPHHRAASGRLEGQPADETKNDPQRHILYGALVGGADINDEYFDDIDQYVYSETGLDYNAGLVGALAGMSKYFGQGQMPEDTPGIKVSRPYTMQTQKYTKKITPVLQLILICIILLHHLRNLSRVYPADILSICRNMQGQTLICPNLLQKCIIHLQMLQYLSLSPLIKKIIFTM